MQRGMLEQQARGQLHAMPFPWLLAKEAASTHLLLKGSAVGHGFGQNGISDKTQATSAEGAGAD